MFVQFSFIFIAHITWIDGVPGQCDESSTVYYIYGMPLLANDNRIAIDSTMCACFNCFWNKWTISDAFESRGFISI